VKAASRVVARVSLQPCKLGVFISFKYLNWPRSFVILYAAQNGILQTQRHVFRQREQECVINPNNVGAPRVKARVIIDGPCLDSRGARPSRSPRHASRMANFLLLQATIGSAAVAAVCDHRTPSQKSCNFKLWQRPRRGEGRDHWKNGLIGFEQVGKSVVFCENGA